MHSKKDFSDFTGSTQHNMSFGVCDGGAHIQQGVEINNSRTEQHEMVISKFSSNCLKPEQLILF